MQATPYSSSADLSANFPWFHPPALESFGTLWRDAGHSLFLADPIAHSTAHLSSASHQCPRSDGSEARRRLCFFYFATGSGGDQTRESLLHHSLFLADPIAHSTA